MDSRALFRWIRVEGFDVLPLLFRVETPGWLYETALGPAFELMVDAVVDQLIADNAFYRTATIPGGMYRGNDNDTLTFGVGATFVSSADVSEDVVYTLVSSVFENIDDFKGLHPAFANLKPEEMAADGLSAPLHAGAEKYYREKGLIK